MRISFERLRVRLRAPARHRGGAVQTFSERHLNIQPDGIVEMSADDAKYLIPYGWTKLAEIGLRPHSLTPRHVAPAPPKRGERLADCTQAICAGERFSARRGSAAPALCESRAP